MRCVVYSRVSTVEQNPESQLQVILDYCRSKGFDIIEVFEENVSGRVDPFKRPIFLKMIKFVEENDIDIIVMYDLTRFYRAKSPMDALNKLRTIMDKHNVLIDFAREPEIDDPLLRELWMFIKSWFATYERLQSSIRTRYGLERVKREGRLYHKPSIEHYYAAWLYNKNFKTLSKEEVETARRQLKKLVEKYWKNKAYKKTKIGEILANNELKQMFERFPQAPKSYLTFHRLFSK